MNKIDRYKILIRYIIDNGIASSQKDFGRKIGYSNESSFSQLINGKVPEPKDFVSRLERFVPDLNPGWLLTGEGEMLKSSNKISKSGGSESGIPFFDINVTGGINESFNDVQEIPQYYISYPPLRDCTAAFPVFGESMEPDYCPGEVVLVKEITNIDSMLWGETYLIITNGNCDNLRTIKNVYITEDRKKFILRASNPRFQGDTLVPIEDVIKIFIVKGKVRRNQL